MTVNLDSAPWHRASPTRGKRAEEQPRFVRLNTRIMNEKYGGNAPPFMFISRDGARHKGSVIAQALRSTHRHRCRASLPEFHANQSFEPRIAAESNAI
jgi:hypothetical protein